MAFSIPPSSHKDYIRHKIAAKNLLIFFKEVKILSCVLPCTRLTLLSARKQSRKAEISQEKISILNTKFLLIIGKTVEKELKPEILTMQ